MNWALKNYLDFKTIQSFLKVRKYSARQKLNNKLLPEMRAEVIDDSILAEQR